MCNVAEKGLSEMNNKWNECLAACTQEILDQRQYSQLNSLLLHGFKKLPNLRGLDFICFIADQINFMFPSLRGRVLPIHIDDAHPLKTKRNSDNNKVVIVKFANRWVKHDILRCERDLSRTPFAVTEHLTDHTLKLLNLAGELVGHGNTWTFKTMVHAQFNGLQYVIKNFNDLKSLEELINKQQRDISSTHTDITNPQPQIPITNSSSSQIIVAANEQSVTSVSAQYKLNYPSLHEALIQRGKRTQPIRGYIMRGMPSRNGRGGGGGSRGSNYYRR